MLDIVMMRTHGKVAPDAGNREAVPGLDRLFFGDTMAVMTSS
jgi:hypothetical protein